MSKHTTTFGGIGLAAALLAAVALSACTEYSDPRKGPPHVIGVLLADVNFNEIVPVNDATCVPPYPEPDPTQIPAGLCSGVTSLCNPVNCYPPRVGPGFAPVYTGGGSVSYPCKTPTATGCTNGVFTDVVPSPEVYTLSGARAQPYVDPNQNGPFTFAQIRILFNILMDGASIQPTPGTCVAPPGPPGPNITFNGAADNANWTVCYVPNSPIEAWGGTMTFTPNSGIMVGGSTYRVTGTVNDQDGNALAVDASVVTQTFAAAPTFANITGTALDVNWLRGGVTSDVQRAPDVAGAPGTFANVATGLTGTTFHDTGLTAGTPVWYRIVSHGSDGVTVITGPSASVTPMVPPAAPTFTGVAATSVTVNWTAAVGAVNYDVQRAPNVVGPPPAPGTFATRNTTPIVGTTYTDTTVTATTYWYRVVARAADGTTVAGASASVTTP